MAAVAKPLFCLLFLCGDGRIGRGQDYASSVEKSAVDASLNACTRQDIPVGTATSWLLLTPAACILAANMTARTRCLLTHPMMIIGALRSAVTTNTMRSTHRLQWLSLTRQMFLVQRQSTLTNSKPCWKWASMTESQQQIHRLLPDISSMTDPHRNSQ